MKKSELIAKLAEFNDGAEIVFEIDGEVVDAPDIFANPMSHDGETIIADPDCCVMRFA